jgi:hypothetical protein
MVTSSDKYYITNNLTFVTTSPTMTTFIVGVPPTAANVDITDAFGRTLTTEEAGTVSYSNSSEPDVLLENATLINFLTSGESTVITATYNLPSATIQGSDYSLGNITLFPAFYYLVDQATCIIVPPEGATIITPNLSSLGTSTTLTRDSFQDTLTITRDEISYVDYSVPGMNTLQFSYNYNPVWVSFRPTLWASLLAVIGCIGAVFYRRRKPSEKETTVTRTERHQITKPTPTISAKPTKETIPVTGQRITQENVREFTDAYEEKKQLNSELKSLDLRAQKGKMPRRQYKVQRRAIEIRLETLGRNTSKLKSLFRASSGAYADLMKQLDSAEADLAEAEQKIKNLETSQNKGAISLENYKKNIADYQKLKDKAESTINGILLRLREKTR